MSKKIKKQSNVSSSCVACIDFDFLKNKDDKIKVMANIDEHPDIAVNEDGTINIPGESVKKLNSTKKIHLTGKVKVYEPISELKYFLTYYDDDDDKREFIKKEEVSAEHIMNEFKFNVHKTPLRWDVDEELDMTDEIELVKRNVITGYRLKTVHKLKSKGVKFTVNTISKSKQVQKTK